MECDCCRKVTRNGERIPTVEALTPRIGFPARGGTHSTAALPVSRSAPSVVPSRVKNDLWPACIPDLPRI